MRSFVRRWPQELSTLKASQTGHDHVGELLDSDIELTYDIFVDTSHMLQILERCEVTLLIRSLNSRDIDPVASMGNMRAVPPTSVRGEPSLS